MSNAGSFQGLQFRIMETLENQPNQAPLTALEIAEILHSGEYRHEMKDNVVFKVSRAVHSMKEQGKIVVTDARDKEGRLCYQLPMRVKFPPKTSDKPANPVLTPEIAAKVQTVEPKPAEKQSGRPVYVAGILDKIVETLDKAPHPMTTSDFVAEFGHLYTATGYRSGNLTTLFSGNLGYLATKKRSIYRRKVKGYGQGILFEYYTRKTGTEPHPLTKKKAAPEPTTSGSAPTPQATPQPTPEDHVREVAPPRVNGGLFRPQRPELHDVELKFRVPAAWNNRVVDAARHSGVSIAEFVRQALDFAMDHLDAS